MLLIQKREYIINKMHKLKGKAREKFGLFLAREFSDEDLKELTPENADKLIEFVDKL